MNAEIIRRYGESRLPRYTSYPTAPRFSASIGAGTYRDWLMAVPQAEPVSLYLHVPFCRSMCWYCGCHTTITQKDAPILDYLTVLKQEIGLVAKTIGRRQEVSDIHFGGGTPTIITPEEFLDLTATLTAAFGIGATTELAVEIDPRTLTVEMAEALGTAGITRASLGVQSFDPKVQKAINRIQSAEQTATALSNLRKAGARSVNFDLIYGLPHQTVESAIDTARIAAAMRPDRFAVFGYAHVPAFKKHQRLIDTAALGDAHERHAQAEAIAATLCEAGYRRIGLDHFALPEDQLSIAADHRALHRNFQGYTTDNASTLIGFGSSAIGRLAEGYAQNDVAIGRYANLISSGELATSKGYRLTQEDRVRAFIIERLMCDFQIDFAAMPDGFALPDESIGADNLPLQGLLAEGIVNWRGDMLTVDTEHRFLVRTVASCFDAYLGEAGRTHATAA
ncbi:oxygen-independent coproporphyrinogen III oxidase [Peteryoungia ipomoeae]|uniref:Coproporphyrinogen-III oxidase n=1 Tax=Peteryoungia ipomoeae TaxID=1210932 RepID=A0A4V4HLZ2_9HYPH|nr:oxygen-independent coproporphyrinogen III oxidase [Peteryoungia ipomoeae]THV20186.1 oxygen-independent coproporphyrinogen III oxidase [Peteryoungia ipomoeae]